MISFENDLGGIEIIYLCASCNVIFIKFIILLQRRDFCFFIGFTNRFIKNID